MQPAPTFTGRSRRRVTHPWVRAGDGLARVLITLGGIGTIVAVLLVGVFLLTVALPLFRPAAARLDVVADLPVADAAPACLGTDDSGGVAWMVERDADGAALRMIGLADGATMLRRDPRESGLEGATVIRVPAGGLQAAVGFGDGSFRAGRIGLESTFVDAADLPAGSDTLADGGAIAAGDGAIVRSGDRYARVRLLSELGPPSRVAEEPIVDVDVAPLAGGPLVAALDAAGRVRVETITSRRNLLTDEVVSTAVGATIEPASDFTPRFVRVSALGDQLFLFGADGAGRRYVIRDIESPVAAETFRAAPVGRGVRVVERLFGGAALAVADSAGDIRVLFASRGGVKLAADGLAMATAREFPAATGSDVTAIAASPRSRLFAVGDSAGTIRLLQSTTGGTVLRMTANAGAAAAVCIAARENKVIAAGGGRLTALAVDAGYAEVSPRTLVGPVWYENYAGSVHAWETTGHEAFESKFGLVPLIFGTVKATFYAMLFATPIAILAAIYASQFMHARWRARIKPTIELMAGLPSVVLGFVAGLVFAPFIEGAVMPVITGLFSVPLALLVGAHLWQLLPAGSRSRLAPWRFAVVGLVALPAGVFAARAAAPAVERILFSGDFRGWLDGRDGNGFGGWMIALLPLSAVVAAMLTGRLVGPWLRQAGATWSPRRSAGVSLAVFAVGLLTAVGIAAAAAVFLNSLRLDARGGLFGTYVQRNALVVGIGMSFAIIPLIFTIADDALTSVPDHLRSASLGAGATPWQTAVRVIVPAAASGLFSAVMIGLGRAVGETMIVLMAAGNTPIIDWNVFNGFQTLSAAIATELPEAARGSAHYRVLFLAALTLFAMTFVVNTVAEIVRQRFRRRAHEL